LYQKLMQTTSMMIIILCNALWDSYSQDMLKQYCLTHSEIMKVMWMTCIRLLETLQLM